LAAPVGSRSRHSIDLPSVASNAGAPAAWAAAAPRPAASTSVWNTSRSSVTSGGSIHEPRFAATQPQLSGQRMIIGTCAENS